MFHLDISQRHLTVDCVKIKLLGGMKSHLCLPDKLIKISPKYRRTKTFHNKVSETNLNYSQDDDILHPGRAWDRDPHGGGGLLRDSLQPLRRKTTEKGKLKATLPDIKTQEDKKRKLTKKDFNRPDVIIAKQTELETLFKFNVIKTVPHAPWVPKLWELHGL